MLTAWVRITPDNRVTLIVSQAAIGQGICTTLPAILADERGADCGSVLLETAPCDRVRLWQSQVTMDVRGNSESIQAFYDHLRSMGAAARTSAAAGDSTAGSWKMIDDRNGAPRAVIRVTEINGDSAASSGKGLRSR